MKAQIYKRLLLAGCVVLIGYALYRSNTGPVVTKQNKFARDPATNGKSSGNMSGPANNASATNGFAKTNKVGANIKVNPVYYSPAVQTGSKVQDAIYEALNMRRTFTLSFGTTKDTIILNGKVKSAAQKAQAEKIARKLAPKMKLVNDLTIGDTPSQDAAPRMPNPKRG